MSFVRMLGMANFVPEQCASKSEVVIEKDGDGFSITSVHLTVAAKIPGIDRETFQSIAAKAKAGCPISKLMTVEIGFEAILTCGEGGAGAAPDMIDEGKKEAAELARKF
jgi:lipoyl-dependent peroxiredoxin